MNRMDEAAEALLPGWATAASLSILFSLILFDFTNNSLPGRLLAWWCVMSPGHTPDTVLMTVFLLYVVLASAAGILAGVSVNFTLRLFLRRRIAGRSKTGY